jgi:hypothetical protein
MKINLVKGKTTKAIISNIIISDIEKYSKWLVELPLTKRGNRAYSIRKDLVVIFTRRDDAVAFRLKFGL